MTAFRILLVTMLVALSAYTALVIADHGWNLLAVFFGDMAKLAWPGQFNLDFMFMLTLSAVWVTWRHAFTPAAFGLGLLAFFGGALFLSVYLLVMSVRTGGDARALVLGESRVA